LGFALVYGYVAAYHQKAERLMIPVLDIMQSIPVLSFLPGVMLAMIALFPHSQLGVELGCILLIFTGQVWNIAFSFYSSLKSIPRELHEAAKIYRFSPWQRFAELDLPFSTIGLVWNSMMSVAGGWFFLMAFEMFLLGQRDFRLPRRACCLCPSRPRLFLPSGAEPRQHPRDSVGCRRDDYRHRASRSAGVAAHHYVGGQIQVRTSRKFRGRADHAAESDRPRFNC